MSNLIRTHASLNGACTRAAVVVGSLRAQLQALAGARLVHVKPLPKTHASLNGACTRAAVVVGSLRAQLQALAGARLATPALHFNADGAVDATHAVAAQWVPSMAGAAFVVGHASGYVYLYHKVGARPARCPDLQPGRFRVWQ